MLFRQITHDDLGCASYVIGDEDAGVAAVVDARLDIDEYLHFARYAGVHIEHILETHNHADHVSGHGRLAAATGATIHIHRAADAEYDHDPFEDGFELDLGGVRVRALHTPGHRPEHTAFALIDSERGGGHVVLVSSLSGKLASVGSSLYSAGKFGLRGFAAGLREDLHGTGVGVTVVFPGFISDAGMLADSGVRLPRWVGTRKPEQVADAVVKGIEDGRREIDVAPLSLRAGVFLSLIHI